jgi:manganese/iron transport system ATP-binding protein/manganese/zinc/iron transport system ATP- binding protein
VGHREDRGGVEVIEASTPAVRLDDVAAAYHDRIVLEDISLSIRPGSLTSIVGPNGAGKSTLLKLIAGVMPARSGTIEVLGAAPGGAAHRIAYVPQAEMVDWSFPVTVQDVVAMGRYPALGPLRRPGAADRVAIQQALARVGMSAFADRQIGRLSGGQRRRVFLARALAAEPDLFLLDEPVTGIDATTQEEIMDILEAQAADGRTVLATTHDLMCVAQRFQEVVAINRTVIAHGPASLVLDADFLARTYGGHLLIVDGRTIALDDAHHHDESQPGERHFHEGSPR